ncbi:MAG: hypothetical protein ACTSPQ_18760 [Candidatus Helarchaeota archaeon]
MLSDEDFYARLVYEAKIIEEEEPSFKPVGSTRKGLDSHYVDCRID